MKHPQALADYRALRALAVGEPHDSGEMLESIADKMLSRPTTKDATFHLCELIELYFQRGDPQGNCLHDIPEAREIFVRHGLIDDEEA
jgi:hypothetical protein